MGDVVFFTGFPGFLGKRVAGPLLQDPAVDEVVFLVQDRFREAARQALSALRPDGTAAGAKATILTADIGAPGLGLDGATRENLRARVTKAWHLAAAYSLALPREVGMRVNVQGTRNVLDLLDGAPLFERLAYISTCAISGSHVGIFSEEDFDVRQTFKNYYEETKYLAEGEVRGRWGRIPTVIFRPPVVVGDARTGEAEKIDGPYYAYVMIARGLSTIAAKSSARFNVAPVDFVATAMLEIMKHTDAPGHVYALSDPAPATFDEFFDITAAAFGVRPPLLRVPAPYMRPFFKFPGMSLLTGIPKQSFDYSVVPVDWPCANTLQALHGTGIRCPQYREYAPVLVKFFRDHLEKTLPRAGRW